MYILYNIIHLFILILFFPVILIYVISRGKYRHQIPRRLGVSLADNLSTRDITKKRIWIHAISVGEVTSALPLVKKIHEGNLHSSIIFSASTQTGYELAQTILGKYCTDIVAFPLDFLPTVKYYLNKIQPDLFILVETDFWPNFLHQLQKKGIPAILVNGRISEDSSRTYKKLFPLTRKVFQTFSAICVQNISDKERFMQLQVEEDIIFKFGNLKYEPIEPKYLDLAQKLLCHKNGLFFIAGSTHPGEERIILESYSALKKEHALKLILAPRKIERAKQIIDTCKEFGLKAQRRSTELPFTDDVLIIDSLGELTSFYHESDICLVGGSLVDSGGHNPLEPASMAKPVLFGQYTSDFDEISKDLIQSGGAFAVHDSNDLTSKLQALITDKDFRKKTGQSAYQCVASNSGVIEKHIELIREII